MPKTISHRTAFLILVLVGSVGAFTSCAPPPQVEKGDEAQTDDASSGNFMDEPAVPPLRGDDLLPDWAATIRDPSALKSPVVYIKITRTSSASTWLLAPKVVGVCKSPTIDCGAVVTWRWLPPMDGVASLHIEAKVDQPNCFDPVDLYDSVPVSVNVNPDDSECPPDTIWEYSVTCMGAADDSCPPPLDPQVHIQN